MATSSAPVAEPVSKRSPTHSAISKREIGIPVTLTVARGPACWGAGPNVVSGPSLLWDDLLKKLDDRGGGRGELGEVHRFRR